MALDFDSTSTDLSKMKSGLLFDAEGVTLISRCSDELAAYRIRRQWSEVLANYFLLEQERDYEMSILSLPENNYHVLNCFFISACGRYAFWRLINDQAPEAELKLSSNSAIISQGKKNLPSLWNPPQQECFMPSVYIGPEGDDFLAEKSSILERLTSTLRNWFR